MTRAEETIRQEIIDQQHIRFTSKDADVKAEAHHYIMELRAELAAVTKQAQVREYAKISLQAGLATCTSDKARRILQGVIDGL